MVEFNNNYVYHAKTAEVLMMSGVVVLSLFFGIKFRWKFRYQMKILNTEALPTSPVKEVRENCTIGRYSCIEDNLVSSTSNCMSSISYSPSFSVKSKKKEHETIFKWPLKSKMNLKEQHDGQRSLPTEPQRREKNLDNLEKNERLKRSIFERLYSSTDSITRDKVMTKDTDNPKSSEIKIFTGVVVNESTQFLTVDEIQMPKRPVRVKMMRKAPNIPVQPNFPKREEEEIVLATKSLKLTSSPLVRKQMPVVVMARKNNNQTYIPSDSLDQPHLLLTTVNEHPKSILKTSSDENQNHTPKFQHITFANVPGSSSPSSSENEDDIWTRIDSHRNQLMRLHENDFSEVDNEVPPLPKTPPPLGEEKPYLREFSFA